MKSSVGTLANTIYGLSRKGMKAQSLLRDVDSVVKSVTTKDVSYVAKRLQRKYTAKGTHGLARKATSEVTKEVGHAFGKKST